MRGTIVKLQKNLASSVWQELYSHKNTVDTALAVTESVKTIEPSTLTALALDESDNAVEIETGKDTSTNPVSARPDTISLELWERMENKFDSLIGSVNQILGRTNYERDIGEAHLGFLRQISEDNQDAQLSVLERIAKAMEKTAACEQSEKVCVQSS